MEYTIGSRTHAKGIPQLYSINDQCQSEDKLCVRHDITLVDRLVGILSNHGDSHFQKKASIAGACVNSTLPSNIRNITVTSEVHVV